MGTSRTARRAKEKYFTPTPYGTRVSIRINGQLHQKHFPKGTDPLTMRSWLVETEIEHRTDGPRTAGAFDQDAARYLLTVAAMPSYSDRKREIEAWVKVFGDRARKSITSAEIATQLHAWRQTLAASTVNHRRTALMHLFTRLDGRGARNPVKDTPRFPEPQPAPRALEYRTIRKILAEVPAGKDKARLSVIAFTGLPHAIIAQLVPENVNLRAKTIAVPGRQKGAGTRGQVLPLTPDGVAAMRQMARSKAWGPFSRWTLRRVFRDACKAAGVKGTYRPYDLRHSFGTEVYRRSGDIRATQVLMLHSTPSLSHRYTLGAVNVRARAALKGFGR